MQHSSEWTQRYNFILEKLKRLIFNILKIFIPLMCGGALLWYMYSKMDMQEMGKILQFEIDYKWILLSAVIGFASHIVRAARWGIQLRALNMNPSMKVLTNAIFGTYAVNLLLPRVGEVWRCGYVAHQEKGSFVKILGSMISERLTDTLAVAILFVVVFFLQMNFIGEFLQKYPALKESIIATATTPWLYATFAGAVLLGIWMFRKKTDNVYVNKTKNTVKNLWNGIKSIFRMKQKWMFLFYTLLMWFLYFLELYVCFFAFKQTAPLGILCAFTCFLLGSISMGLPVQGGLGPWHWTIIGALTLYGLSPNVAGTFALVAHGVQFVLVILLGIYTFFSISLAKRKNNIKI
ncbi:MAG: lysylphosphatidylglycerol synthase transmembrane domain-containing protein [Bacteroidales bacterium]